MDQQQLSLLIALGAGILGYVAFALLFPKAIPKESDDYLKNALDRLAEENRESERRQAEVLRDVLSETKPWVRMLFSLGFMRPIYEAALQAGYQQDIEKVALMMPITFAVVLGLGMQGGMGSLSFVAAAILAFYVPYKHCLRRVRKRNNKFIDQFPDALDTIVRSVRSGFPLSVALQMLSDNAEEPVRGEFRQVTDEVALGRSLPQALQRLAARINEPDVRFFVVVLTVQQETGGNLAEIVGNLSGIIRKRKQIRHKIKALTSEGKATGLILGALPVLVFGLLQYTQPGYLKPFFTDPMGHKLLGTAVGLLVACFFVVRAMITIDI